MTTYRLALIGFGNVGQGLAKILLDRGPWLEKRFDAKFVIVAISDVHKGSCYDPDGLSISELLESVDNTNNLEKVTAPHLGWDSLRTIRDSNADIIIEISYTDLETGEPALTHTRSALQSGKHVVTTNKGPIALYFPELIDLARKHNVEIGVEGTVMSGTPVLRVGMDIMQGAVITQIKGILNGTTNYILTQMENGISYNEALLKAQDLGYAEANPDGDVKGHDAAGKIVILANLLMDVPLRMQDVSCTGIIHITEKDISTASKDKKRWKLVGVLDKTDNSCEARVQPELLPHNHPLYSVSGATNAITYTTELLGDVTLIGPGAGRIETGYALLEDLLGIHRSQNRKQDL